MNENRKKERKEQGERRKGRGGKMKTEESLSYASLVKKMSRS